MQPPRVHVQWKPKNGGLGSHRFTTLRSHRHLHILRRRLRSRRLRSRWSRSLRLHSSRTPGPPHAPAATLLLPQLPWQQLPQAPTPTGM